MSITLKKLNTGNLLDALFGYDLSSRTAILVIVLLTLLLHLLLGLFSPYQDGYVYDFYSEAVLLLHSTGSLPSASDCWVCYHPPLLAYIGSYVLSFAELAGMNEETQLRTLAYTLNAVSLIFLYFSYKIYLQFRIDNGKIFDIGVLMLLCFLPVVVISSHAIEADILLSTLVVIGIYYFKVYALHLSTKYIFISAISLGLASLTKYVGALVAFSVGMFLLYRWVVSRKWTDLKNGAIFGLVVILIGSAPYINNFSIHGTPFNGNAAWNQGNYSEFYNFTNFSLSRIINTFTDTPGKTLGEYSVYSNEYISSHYGQLWTDHSFFSVPTRHGQPHKNAVYDKGIPIWVIWSVLLAGLPVTIMALVGATQLIVRREALILVAISLITISAYISWTFNNHAWMLKTKYFLFLVPLFMIAISYPIRKYSRLKNTIIYTSAVVSCIYSFYFAVS